MKTKIMKAIALCLALVLCFGSAISVSAAEVADASIDESQKGSLTIFKYDLTGSENAGIWDSSYVSTGVADESGVKETMKNYALEGVEFSFVKVADIVQFTESTADNRTDNHVEVLYAIDKVQGADFLKALGLENGANRYQNADQMDTSKYFYQSDVLIQALSAALTANSTVVKNAMEQYIAAIGGTAMSLTDSFGKTKAENLTLGLYLIVETKVPENVVSTTDPFLISLPMTSVNGTNATDGGTRWIYDVTVYPKNQTGDPTLEKTLRESNSNTGKNNGTAGITDGFAHAGTASGGDTVEYQIISTLFYLYVLDEILAYQISEINTVLPSDTSLLGIWEGEDYCTLVTCTPYGVNTHRLLVTGSRIPYEEAEQIAEQTETESGSGSHWMQYYLRGLEIGLAVVAGFLVAAFLLFLLWKWINGRLHHG